MFNRMFDTDKYHTLGSHEIDRRVRERERLYRWLEAENPTRAGETRKPIRKGLAALLASLFSLSL